MNELLLAGSVKALSAVDGTVVLAQSRIGDATDKKAGGAIEQLLAGIPFVRPVLFALGGALFVFMIVKIVVGLRKGGGGAAIFGQALLGLFGVMLVINPTFIAALADGFMRVGRQLFDFFGKAVGS